MHPICRQVREELLASSDAKYQSFQATLIPNIPPETIIGVRTPVLRAMAKKLAKDPARSAFLEDLPHGYFEENQLHGFVIEQCRDYDAAMALMENFLPYIDNWATCDQVCPKVFITRPGDFLVKIDHWLHSGHPYTVRYAIGCLMRHFLDERFEPAFAEKVASVPAEDYYVKMMVAWYFATALAKQYETAVTYLEEDRLPVWIHNKTIQKAVESYRITPEQKQYLRSLRRKT